MLFKHPPRTLRRTNFFLNLGVSRWTFVDKETQFLAMLGGLIGLLLFCTACNAFRPLLSDVTVNPSTISPNADGLTDVTRISYHLARSADLSIYLVDGQNQRHYFRQDRRRSEGDYRVDFGGVVDGSMLPDAGGISCEFAV